MQSVEKQIGIILDEFCAETNKQVQMIAQEVSDNLAETLKATSPVGKKGKKKSKNGKRRKKYSKSWKNIKEGKKHIVFNKGNAQLTHLLEKGHATVDGGRTKPQPHIKPAVEKAEHEFMRKIGKNL